MRTRKERAKIYRMAAEHAFEMYDHISSSSSMCFSLRWFIGKEAIISPEEWKEFYSFKPTRTEVFSERGYTSAWWYNFDYPVSPRVLVLLFCEQMCYDK